MKTLLNERRKYGKRRTHYPKKSVDKRPRINLMNLFKCYPKINEIAYFDLINSNCEFNVFLKLFEELFFVYVRNRKHHGIAHATAENHAT